MLYELDAVSKMEEILMYVLIEFIASHAHIYLMVFSANQENVMKGKKLAASQIAYCCVKILRDMATLGGENVKFAVRNRPAANVRRALLGVEKTVKNGYGDVPATRARGWITEIWPSLT